ncbi:TetR family transcriptional regulator [Kaistia sp. 32K]|uniref:TetR/AcrR family transcriptional regulator n=1 Tax=Kaistia sp. 32K TaxID=2795690 RepID=UPI0019152035|nr:TetR/AcrR family transcriptional regulator [Kaistia sp. 32K]BCP54020.1 TetR family transcriptional regulator [Kaistia sp. 32K]
MSTFKVRDNAGRGDGIRETKRRETHRRIAEAGVRLFLERGYEATTLDAIAEAAEISRRTFFAYFRSKDEILRSWQLGGWEAFLDDLRQASPDELPLQAIRGLFPEHLSRYSADQLKAIAKIMSSSEGLRATKHAAFAEQEMLLFEVLCEVWRQPERRLELRLVAMSAVGALRVAVERWDLPGNQRPLQQLFVEILDALESAFP